MTPQQLQSWAKTPLVSRVVHGENCIETNEKGERFRLVKQGPTTWKVVEQLM